MHNPSGSYTHLRFHHFFLHFLLHLTIFRPKTKRFYPPCAGDPAIFKLLCNKIFVARCLTSLFTIPGLINKEPPLMNYAECIQNMRAMGPW